LAWCAFA